MNPVKVLKQQMYPEKQDHSTDSAQERPSIFTEIWPSSEPSSPSDTPTSDKNVQKVSRSIPFELDTSQSSLLARYVDRFRHGRPQSREERQQKASNDEDMQLPFWWTTSPSLPTSLATEESKYRLPAHDQAYVPCSGSINISDTPHCELAESEILHLQEKANRLLQKGEFCLEEDSLPVSSDGVGCSDFSSPVSTEEPVRRPVISRLHQCNIVNNSTPVILPPVAPARPEEDILFQWRLRRKMEKAREWTLAQQHFNLQDLHLPHPTSQTIHPTDLTQGIKHQPIREPHLSSPCHQICPTTSETTRTKSVNVTDSTIAPPQALVQVPSHMHLLCDILPCRIQQPHSLEEAVPQRLNSGAILPQISPNLISKDMSLPKPVSGSAEKNISNPKSPENLKKHPEKSDTITVFSKQRKKSPGIHSREKFSQQQKQKYTKFNKNGADGASPHSPIHNTLGQIVSEVLFPSVDSVRDKEFSPATPSCSVSPPQTDQNSGKAILQLLLDTEDSDEKEFEDDPLLQVLRKQRKWVKEEINAMDTLLKEFP